MPLFEKISFKRLSAVTLLIQLKMRFNTQRLYTSWFINYIQEKMSQKIRDGLITCVWCWHTKAFHFTDKDGYEFCKKCKCHTFVGHTTEVFEC